MTFPTFFTALWSTPEKPRSPFPWQAMLADRPTWPAAIDLPTASGKTACMDAAIYRIATAAAGAAADQPMPRRLWFVVDRRIVVDEAFLRATAIAKKLSTAENGPLKDIADKLKALSGTGIPLAVARLRGGSWRDDKGWASDPRQPAVICTTVDQIGSSLLFRAYGHGDLTASVYAGLAGNDSLIILDEAHCSEPFRQTLEAIHRFRQQPWSAETSPVPFAFTIMSATLPKELRDEAFPSDEDREAALDHDILRQRANAEKQATLTPPVKDDTAFLQKARDQALAAIEAGRQRIAVMVNRVATASGIYDLLKSAPTHDTVLITGRMRPMDRDKLIADWSPKLASGANSEPAKPVIVVTTQCLEVGADFSFDHLITECASLDALRQRFGRLDRLGTIGSTQASILIREKNVKAPEEDPIYGPAIHHTWTWLNEIGEKVQTAASAAKKQAKKGAEPVTADASTEPAMQSISRVNFGIAALAQKLATLAETDDAAEHEQRRLPQMLAPQPDAPILLPGHLDLLCQTGPRPSVEPDISLYLHGKGRTSAEVRIVFRCDCPDDNLDDYLNHQLPLLPPTSPEALSVPLHRFRQWLRDQANKDTATKDTATEDTAGDVEGEAAAADESLRSKGIPTIPFIRWRGRKKSKIGRQDTHARAGDLIVLPARTDYFAKLGQPPSAPDAAGAERLDLAERAALQAKGRVTLRLTDEVWSPWKHWPTVQALLDCRDEEDDDYEKLWDAIVAVREEQRTAWKEGHTDRLPAWLLQQLRLLTRVKRFAFQSERATNGLILISKRRFRVRGIEAEPFGEDEADERSRSKGNWDNVPLREHTAQVQRLATAFATNRWPAITDEIHRAAFAHDLGKLDPRFQMMLRGGDYSAFSSDPLAKSTKLPTTERDRREIEETQRLPAGFRHEMLSAQLAEHLHIAHSPLALHLITSHHGHSRPFVPITEDSAESQQAAGPLLSEQLQLSPISAEERSKFPRPHHLGQGHTNRFWQLTRQHGWWGLSYAEMLLRLADWQASAQPDPKAVQPIVPEPILPSPIAAPTELPLPGIDGSNPLGFLAALGILRSLSHAWPAREVRLHWQVLNGSWKAVISYASDCNAQDKGNEVITALSSTLKLGFKPQTEGYEAREQAQRDLGLVIAQIEEAKAFIKKRKLKGEAKKAAEAAEIEPLKQKQTSLEAATIDPTVTAKKAFDAKKKAVKDAVNALKKRKLKGNEQKAARAELIAPLEAEMEQARQAWLTLLRTAVPFREMALGKRVDVPSAEYREVAEQTLDAAEWWPAEMLCHFSNDGITDRGTTEPTQLSFINGSGHQFFLETALELTRCVTQEKLHAALFAPWVPEDEKYSMRWLPSEDRRYALMASNPSGGEKTLTVWAANLLGYAGLGLLPSAPGNKSLETTGIIPDDKEPVFRWPLWQQPLSALAVSSLISIPPTNTSPATTHRQSKRIEVGDGANKKINFTPSVAC